MLKYGGASADVKRPTILGWGMTAIWLLAFGTVVYLKFRAVWAMSPNEWGDFFAGVSAPIAVIWLVIGYFQHGEELRLNTEALLTQQKELKQQVAETALLVEAANQQAQAARTGSSGSPKT